MDLKSLAVLVIDDSTTDRTIVRAMLQKMGVGTVHEAESGAIGDSKLRVAHLTGDPYQIVVLDWNMPQINGLKFLKTLKADALLKDAKVIVMTGTSRPDVVQAAIQNGVSDFIVKPVTLALLKEKIDKIAGAL